MNEQERKQASRHNKKANKRTTQTNAQSNKTDYPKKPQWYFNNRLLDNPAFVKQFANEWKTKRKALVRSVAFLPKARNESTSREAKRSIKEGEISKSKQTN